MAQALRLSDAQQQELVEHAAGLRSQGGLLQRITRLPGRLVRGSGANGGVQGTHASGTPRNGKVSIASDWVQFLTDEDGRSQSQQEAQSSAADSGAPASLQATPRAGMGAANDVVSLTRTVQ